MEPKPILILGTGGTCVDILDILLDINDHRGEEVYSPLGFLDDQADDRKGSVCGLSVLGHLPTALNYPPDCVFVNGIGSPANFWRKPQIIATTNLPPDRFATIVHPTASVSRTAKLGVGTVVMQNAAITSNVAVGNHVVILPNSVISHDSVVGDYTCIAGCVCVSGKVSIGACCYVGAQAVVRDGVEIGERCLVGMGAVVLDDVAPNSVVVGNPARFLRHTCD